MEILNNIWTILTNENEMVTRVITLPFLFVEVYLTLLVFTSILKINYTTKQKNIYVLLISIISLLNAYIIPAPFNIIINYISVFIIVRTLFNLSYIKCILSLMLPLTTFAIINALILIPYLHIFNITSKTMESTPLYRSIFLFIMYFTIYIFILFMKNRPSTIFSHSKLDKHSIYTIIINLILGIIMLLLQAFINFYYINTIPIAISLLNFILLLAYFTTSYFSLTRTIKLYTTKQNLETAESYNNSLSILYDNVRGFKHDFDNMINIIGGYIKNNDMEGLKKYYSGLENDCTRVTNMQLLNPKIINNPGIYNLIVSKHKKATELDIKINLEIFFDFNALHMPIYEFSRILGILLDNAIEATKECKEKEINLIFRESRRNRTQIIRIENTYTNKNIDTEKIFEKGFSEKENHTGIGLWEVQQIISKNNNTSLHTTKEEKYFKQQLEIYY